MRAFLLALLVLGVPAAITVSLAYIAHRVGCNQLYEWEIPADCHPGLYSLCEWTPACVADFEDVENREIWDDLHRHSALKSDRGFR